jgi:hypothetical protein
VTPNHAAMRPAIRLILSLLLLAPTAALTAEGMWTLDNLPRA